MQNSFLKNIYPKKVNNYMLFIEISLEYIKRNKENLHINLKES